MAKRLGLRTGNLYRSFGRNHPDSLFEVKQTAKGFDVTIGSKAKYAAIQNYGGFIKSKGKMHKYFWAMNKQYPENPFYKIMALSVKKNGGVKINPTFYFDESIKELKNNILPEKMIEVIKLIESKSTNIDDYTKLQSIFENEIKVLANKMPDYFSIAFAKVTNFRSKTSKLNNPKTTTWV